MATIKQYAQLEARIHTNDLDALMARWEFGHMLLAERGAAKRLPNGRIEELLHACHSCSSVEAFRTEVSRRMTFAERYPTREKAQAAFKTYESWHQIVNYAFLIPLPLPDRDEHPLGELHWDTWDLGDNPRAVDRLNLLDWVEGLLVDARNRLAAAQQHHGADVADLVNRVDLLLYDLDRRWEAIVHGGLSPDRGLMAYASAT